MLKIFLKDDVPDIQFEENLKLSPLEIATLLYYLENHVFSTILYGKIQSQLSEKDLKIVHTELAALQEYVDSVEEINLLDAAKVPLVNPGEILGL